MADDLKQLLEEQGQRINKHTDEKSEETKRHFDVVAENLEKNIVGAMKEELDIHGQQITALQVDVTSLKQDMAQVKDDVAAITVTFESKSPAKSNGLPFLKPNYENP